MLLAGSWALWPFMSFACAIQEASKTKEAFPLNEKSSRLWFRTKVWGNHEVTRLSITCSYVRTAQSLRIILSFRTLLLHFPIPQMWKMNTWNFLNLHELHETENYYYILKQYKLFPRLILRWMGFSGRRNQDNVPPGLDALVDLNRVLVHQQLEWCESKYSKTFCWESGFIRLSSFQFWLWIFIHCVCLTIF